MKVINAAGRALFWALDVPPIFVILAFVPILIIQSHRGYLVPESRTYLAYYTADRPLLVTLLDDKGTENGLYQARELSYLVDYLDYNLCRLSARLGFPHYLSCMSYVGLVILAFFVAAFCRKALDLSRPMTNAFLLLLFTHPTILLLGPLYRSAKIGAAVCMAGLCCAIGRRRSDGTEGIPPGRPPMTQMLLVFLFSFAAAWFDRQGFFLVAAGAFLLVLYSTVKRHPRYIFAVLLLAVIIAQPYRASVLPSFAYSTLFLLVSAGAVFLVFYALADRHARFLAGAMAAAVVVHQVYNWQVLPRITEAIVGYRPSFDYQFIDPASIRGRALEVFGWGAGLFADNLRWLLGSMPLLPCAVLCLVALWVTVRDAGGSNRLPKPSAVLKDGRVLVFCAGSLLIMAMFAVMASKDTAILHPELRMSYYPLPSVVLMLLGLAWMVSPLRNWRPAFQNLALTVLLILFILNLSAWPGYMRTVEQSDRGPYIRLSRQELRALSETSTPFQKFVSTSETAYGAGGLEGRGRPSKGLQRKDATNRSVLERHRGGAPVRYSVSEVRMDF